MKAEIKRIKLKKGMSASVIFAGVVSVASVLVAALLVSYGVSAYAPAELTLTQTLAGAEVSLVSADYAPSHVGYTVSNDPNCDSDFYGNVMISFKPGNGGLDGYRGGFEKWSANGNRPHYQGGGSDDWRVVWQADNNHEFIFKYPTVGLGTDSDGTSIRPFGKYLCVSINYHDDLAWADRRETYGSLELLYIERTNTEPTDAGTDYEFTANRPVKWLAKKASSILSCDFEAGSGQLTTDFTLEANGQGYANQSYCVTAEDSAGVQVHATLFISEEDAVPVARAEPESTEAVVESTPDQDNGGQIKTETQPVPEETNPDNTDGQMADINPGPVPEEYQPAGVKIAEPVAGQSANDNSTTETAVIDGTDDVGTADQQQIVASPLVEEEVEIAVVDDAPEGMPEADIIDNRDWWQLLGFFIIAFAILGVVGVLVWKKEHRKT